MTVVFDLDNTIIDQFGATLRPGIVRLIGSLKADGHRVVLWTNSTRQRAKDIMKLHGISSLFDQCVFREDYDPDERDVRKDIRKVSGDLIVDDDPDEIRFARSVGRGGFVISPFRRKGDGNRREIAQLEEYLRRFPRRWWLPRALR